ncbi:hypothetical protein GGR51DRAFT_569423 [Nemania sp. FL0031]|nr:hypothetical protein GGR51DRAFT_569423 [Nemania sp. FL0031]
MGQDGPAQDIRSDIFTVPGVHFKLPSRPSPLPLDSSTKTSPEIVRTPYPRKIYDLAPKPLPPELQHEIHTYLRNYWPADSFDVSYKRTLLAVTSQWELRRPKSRIFDRDDSLPDFDHDNSFTNFVHAHHIDVEIRSVKRADDEWESMVECICLQILPKYNTLDAAVEFFYSSDACIVSRYYRPELDKTKLKAFFEDNVSRDPGLGLGPQG